ncbi:50S ribosomal protein L15 [Anaplasma centrale str. Israel]|uniref:Large ribosomal subunit protein uL15 n=1 Tax=Anaplasma centrale (strain Israel) TaxID=574556 RepID=D1AU47_ANACI|nr:50S ribosomal protein L15 [Anaplasma centrale]ACZ49075.1 50S ribosomal protein L15 [Anaplasma centrale str. Israel]
MKLNELFAGLPKRKGPKVLGRGLGCGKGKTSGRGHKGQKARSGCAVNGFEGGQQPIFTRLPKRGFRSVSRVEYEIVNLGAVQKLIDGKKIVDVSNISKELMAKLGMISSPASKVKVLGKGALKAAKVGISYDAVSKAAGKKVYLPEG